MPTPMQTALIGALEAIEARLDANPDDPEKPQLTANGKLLATLLSQADTDALNAAAAKVTLAAAALQHVIDVAGSGPLDGGALGAAGAALRNASTGGTEPAPVAPPPSTGASAATTAPPATSNGPAGGSMHGIDCALDCTGSAAAIAAAGKAFVVRYYRNDASHFAPLTATEAKALSAAGLKVAAVWESASDKAAHFSHTSGMDEGTSAYKQAMLAGQPAETPIYFAVDFDCGKDSLAGPINDYFQAVATAFAAMGHGNSAYKVGVYGSGRACAWLRDHGLVTHTWLALSTGWAGFHDFTTWSMKQGPNDHRLPFDYDTDEARGDFGGFVV